MDRLSLIKIILSSKKSRLPSFLQEVEYLQSTGVQLINIGCKIKNTDIVRFSFIPTTYSSTASIFDDGGSPYYRARQITNINTIQINPAYMVGVWARIENLSLTQFNNITINNTGIYFNNNKVSTYVMSIDETTNNLTIFGTAKMKMKYFKVEGVRNLIPCYRKSDHKPGMYDLVNNVFYTNQGTGADFIVGADVNGSDDTKNFSTQTLQGKNSPFTGRDRIITKGFTSGGEHFTQLYIYGEDAEEVWYVNGGSSAQAFANGVWEIEYKTLQFDSGVFLTDAEKSALLNIYDKI